jgi:D-alanine--poly(phosphoribitol) ligase subunit 1
MKAATETDIQKIAVFNRTDAAFPEHVVLQQLIEAEIERHPDATAVICDHDRVFGVTSLSCAALNEKANQLAGLLRSEGAGPGQVVAIMVERSLAMIIGILGVLKAGAAYLPLQPDNPPERTDYTLADAGVQTLLGHSGTATPRQFKGRIIALDDPEVFRGPTQNPAVLNTPRDLAYVIYTSGSTGKPKGVMIEHRSVVNRLHWMQHRYPVGPGDVILQKTPYCFDVAVWELLWWALSGATLCFLVPRGERNPLAIVAAVRRHRVTVMHFVPSMFSVFLDYLGGKDVRRDLGSVRQLFASGEALTPSHVKKFQDVWSNRTPVRLTNLYGPTEATVDVTYYDCPAGNDIEVVPIGRPIHNTRIYIVKDGQQAAIGEAGELCIAGVSLARGYINNSGLTDERFVDNLANLGERLYRTGDLARWLPDGNVEYLGREDQQVKIRGLRIELGEIENTIRNYPDVIDCVSVVKTLSEHVLLIVAYIVSTPALEIASLKQFLKNHLPDYMIPSHFERIDAIPLTPSGKADRSALREAVIQITSARGTRA